MCKEYNSLNKEGHDELHFDDPDLTKPLAQCREPMSPREERLGIENNV
ncbi:255_t:CDS:1, partial [Acaulospora morrowiae]